MSALSLSSNLRSRNRKVASDSSPEERSGRSSTFGDPNKVKGIKIKLKDYRKVKRTNNENDSINNENIAPTTESAKKSPKRKAKEECENHFNAFKS